MIVPDITDEEISEELTRVQGFLSDIGSELKEILTDSPWGRRRLAYTIRFNNIDYRDGYYAVIHFSARPDSLFELERELKLDTRVMRYLLVHDDPKAGIREPNNPERGSADGEAPAGSTRPAATRPETTPATATETPTSEASSTETPATDVSTTEAPESDATSTDVSATEEAPVEATSTDAAATEEAPVEATTDEVPATEAPVAEETAAEPVAVGAAVVPAEDAPAETNEEE